MKQKKLEEIIGNTSKTFKEFVTNSLIAYALLTASIGTPLMTAYDSYQYVNTRKK